MDIKYIEDQQKVLLKLLNGILTINGKEAVTNITDFKEIDRLIVINEKSFKFYEELESELHQHFNKILLKWYGRKNIKYYLVVVLKNCAKTLNMKLTIKRREVGEMINGKYYKCPHIYYSIEK